MSTFMNLLDLQRGFNSSAGTKRALDERPEAQIPSGQMKRQKLENVNMAAAMGSAFANPLLIQHELIRLQLEALQKGASYNTLLAATNPAFAALQGLTALNQQDTFPSADAITQQTLNLSPELKLQPKTFLPNPSLLKPQPLNLSLLGETSLKTPTLSLNTVNGTPAALTTPRSPARKKSPRSKKQSSKYRGVSRCKKDGRFQARIRIGSHVKYLGRYKTEYEAAIRYDTAARHYHGERALPNFAEDGSKII